MGNNSLDNTDEVNPPQAHPLLCSQAATSLEAKARVPYRWLILTASIDSKYAPIALWNSVSHLTYFSLWPQKRLESVHDEGLWNLAARQGQKECEMSSRSQRKAGGVERVWSEGLFIWSAATASLFSQINHHYLIASHPASISDRAREVEPGAAEGTWCGG